MAESISEGRRRAENGESDRRKQPLGDPVLGLASASASESDDSASESTNSDKELSAVGRGPDLRRFLALAVVTVFGFAVLMALGWIDRSLPLAEPTTVETGLEVTELIPDAVSDPSGPGAEPSGSPGLELDRSSVAELADELASRGWPGLAMTASGSVLTISGDMAGEAERAEVLAVARGRFGEAEIVDRLMVASGDPAQVRVEVSQATLLVEGTVPNRLLVEELLARAGALYVPEQIFTRLEVDRAVRAPVTITVAGTVTDPVLFERVAGMFSGIVGTNPVLTDDLVLGQPDDLEVVLNDLEPILFASGSAVILSESAAVLALVVSFLTANPNVVVEIGGHVDSEGSDETNRSLSLDRADAVRTELIARGVTNELVAHGFGASRRRAATDGTPDSESADHRVEFRILNSQ